MSFYDKDGSWAAPGRQPSWEGQRSSQPPTRSASGSTAPTTTTHIDPNAFALQFEEIERATDNLMKSGKWYPGSTPGNVAGGAGAPARRDSMPAAARSHDFNTDHHHHRAGGPSRHQSVSGFDAGRPGPAGLQDFYSGQRFPPNRPNDAEQALQAKRRMAAQRERELRNYHQEQQYNRTVPGPKPDRSLSPNTMSEEDRRDLIARQHRALYGDSSPMYNGDGVRSHSQDARGPTGRGPSPLAFEPYSQKQAGKEGAVQMPPRDRVESSASPIAGGSAQSGFSLMSEAQQAVRASSASPSGSPPLVQGQKGGLSGVAPIGTRPTPSVPVGGKRSTTPMTPSSLSYGFNASDAAKPNGGKEERSASAASNPALGSWGTNSGWGSSKNTLAVQPSVWG